MSNREIVIFNRDVPAGVSSILKNIIQYKPPSEIQYKLILYHAKEENREKIREDWCKNVIRIKYSHYDNLYHFLYKLKHYVNEESPLVASDIMELRFVALLKLKNPLIYIIHGDFETYYSQCDIFQDYMDLIVCYSKFILHKLQKRLKDYNRCKLRLIYYPVPAIPELAKSSLRVLKIIFVGSLVHRKGVDLLPHITTILNNKHLSYHLEIIGSGELEEYLQIQFKDKNNIKMSGQLTNNEVLDKLQNAHVLLFPTRSEGLPNILVEAMKAGCVPIVSHIPSGIPDVVENGKNGMLVEPDDIQGFADAIVTLSSDENKLRSMSILAIKKANLMFDPVQNALDYYTAFISASKKVNCQLHPVNPGRLLNQPWLPNRLVRGIRKLNLSNKL